MSAYVLDASVAAKWFLPQDNETLVAEAVSVLDDFAASRVRLLVPDLFWPEVGNIFWKAVRIGRMSNDSAAKAISSLRELNLPTSPSHALLSDAFTIAVTFERSVYDCMYVSLAVASNRLLLTADERLANSLASHFPVRWLGLL